MKKLIIIIIFFCSFFQLSQAQKSVLDSPKMNQRIKHSVQEDDRNKETLTQQTANTIFEKETKKKFIKLKEVTAKINARWKKYSYILSYLEILKDTKELGEDILKDIEKITIACWQQPIQMIFYLPQVEDLGKEVELYARYIAVIMVGEVSQTGFMNIEPSNRKIITNHVRKRLLAVRKKTNNLVHLIEVSKRNKLRDRKPNFNNYKPKEIEIAREIIEKAKRL